MTFWEFVRAIPSNLAMSAGHDDPWLKWIKRDWRTMRSGAYRR